MDKLLIALLAIAAIGFTTGCGDDEPENLSDAMEEAGENLEDAANDAADALEDATN